MLLKVQLLANYSIKSAQFLLNYKMTFRRILILILEINLGKKIFKNMQEISFKKNHTLLCENVL